MEPGHSSLNPHAMVSVRRQNEIECRGGIYCLPAQLGLYPYIPELAGK